MSLTDRQCDREVLQTDRVADDAEDWSDVMPFGRADPIPRVRPPPLGCPCGEAQAVDRAG